MAVRDSSVGGCFFFWNRTDGIIERIFASKIYKLAFPIGNLEYPWPS
jgi:hypothetical protein